MRKLVLIAIFCSGVFYAPLPLIAQNGGGGTPLIPVADMPDAHGGATAPSELPLEVEPDAVPELVPPEQVNGGGGTSAPPATPVPAPTTTTTPAPAPEPAPEPTATLALSPAAQEAQAEEPQGEVPETPNVPTTPEQQDEPDEEEFEEEFDDIPESGEPDGEALPRVTAGPQLPQTGADLPALLLSGLALTASGMSLRALCSGRA